MNINKVNESMLVDFYEFTMTNGYFVSGLADKKVVFDMFFRKVPDNGSFAIMAGLEQVIEYIENLHFADEDIEYLSSRGIFSEDFLGYLKDFEFTCDIDAVPEGTPIFPQEPIVRVKGPLIQAQFIETMLLMHINHQSLIATKARRLVKAAKGRNVVEFGSRRAQGSSGALLGARAAYIGGCSGTACTLADQLFKVPALGTMAHSWVQLFTKEEEAFRRYCEIYPENAILLVDTYDVLNSGIPNAIKVFNEILIPKGFRPKGVRIDSGDMAYLSRQARVMLDEAGFNDCIIFASNSLDEVVINDLINNQNAQIDSFGVGECLITSKSDPVFGGVYKLSAVDEKGEMIPKIKLSENVEKITNPGYKNVWRLYDKKTNKAIADVLTLADEFIDTSKPYHLFDPDHTWKQKLIADFTARQLLEPVFDKGKCVYKRKSLAEIRDYCKEELNSFWEEILRLERPQPYFVDLSLSLWKMRKNLITEHIFTEK
ncbi:nicotinate phosphoribosyltransferase [endosymbiont 'TC1' of Trimyema compressum]|uniref:nicotinate phosphoribosyltransferase n=1 Tax=endosymbiont 'TC1' of Trimyema compressum TaxID=243899 RepID=UPI0007F05B80|nr:nicotinate phosphoribosyltransferase [endosymbiont 'TC1' of Trimyema compressum]AMP20545.1 nicotinate phosphoribosyltransferase [endosymbiont 'TC1' of Trimyema compressum]